MKRRLKRIVIIVFLIIYILNFFCMNNNVYAVTEGTVNSIVNLMGGIASIIWWPKRIIITSLAFITNLVTTMLAKADGIVGSENINFVTPFHIFFNQLQIIDINVLNLDINQNSVSYTIRSQIAKWYYIMRLIASVILLIILIYIGIRMAISSIASDRAMYKKMLIDWVTSLAIIFLLHYVVTFIIGLNSSIVNALAIVTKTLNIENNNALEHALGAIGGKALTGVGISSLTATAVYAMLIFQTLAFLIAYINRMIKVSFLIIISPLITITYAIDKMGDGKAQALETWLKEFLFTVLIQPFHCIIYMSFISVAFGLITAPQTGSSLLSKISSTFASSEYNQLANAVLAILAIKFVSDGEKVVRKIFGFSDDNQSTSMGAGAGLALAAVTQAKNIGKSARKITNAVTNTKLFSAVSNDISKLTSSNKFNNSRLGKIIGETPNTMQNTGSGISNKAEKVNFEKSKAKSARGLKMPENIRRMGKSITSNRPMRAIAKVGKVTGRWIRSKNSLSSALGLATGLMAYGSGSTSALEALGAGSATSQAAEEYFNTSTRTLVNNGSDALGAYLDPDRKEREAQGKRTEAQAVREKAQAVTDMADKEKEKGNDREASQLYAKAKGFNRRADTLETEASALDKEIALLRDPEQVNKKMSKMLPSIIAQGRQGWYKPNSGRMKKMVQRLENTIAAINHNEEEDASIKSNIIFTQIASNVMSSDKPINLSQIIQNTMGPDLESGTIEYSKLYQAAEDIYQFETEAAIYNGTFEPGIAVGLDEEVLMNRIIQKRTKKVLVSHKQVKNITDIHQEEHIDSSEEIHIKEGDSADEDIKRMQTIVDEFKKDADNDQ